MASNTIAGLNTIFHLLGALRLDFLAAVRLSESAAPFLIQPYALKSALLAAKNLVIIAPKRIRYVNLALTSHFAKIKSLILK